MNLPNLYLHKFQINLQALEDMKLPPFKGSMFRGAFGWSFRKAVCVTGFRTCDGCMLQSQCSYFRIFETEMPDNDLWFLKGVQKVPHPFIIHPPLDDKTEYKKGEIIELNLTLFGEIYKMFPFFAYTFQQMGSKGISVRRHKYELLSIYSLDKDENKHLVFNSNSKTLNENYQRIDVNDILNDNGTNGKNKLKIEFLSPLRLQYQGSLITNKNDLSIEHLIRAIKRRYFALSYLFCDGVDSGSCNGKENEINAKITDNQLYYYNWERFSSRQQRKISLGGLMGGLTIEGNLNEITPLIKIGTKINLGKNTIFGLGEYETQFI